MELLDMTIDTDHVHVLVVEPKYLFTLNCGAQTIISVCREEWHELGALKKFGLEPYKDMDVVPECAVALS
jgi:hypothetical protein